MDTTNKNPIAKRALRIYTVTMKKKYTTAKFVVVRGYASTGSTALTAKSALRIYTVAMKRNCTTANFVLEKGYASTRSAALTASHAEVQISANITNYVTCASHAVAAKSVSTKSDGDVVQYAIPKATKKTGSDTLCLVPFTGEASSKTNEHWNS